MSDGVAPGPETDPAKKKKTALERFGVKPNPFGVQSSYVVGRDADFRRIAALPRRTHWRDFSEAITLAFALPPVKPGTCPYRCPCNGTGKMKLRPLQAWALSEIFEQRGGIGILGVGTGKAQPLDVKVYTPTGPKQMGDIRVSDEVCTPDGKVAKVVGIFPQGVRQIYKVMFSDGSSTECCDEHLWAIRDNNMRKNDARNKRYVQTQRPKHRAKLGRPEFEVHKLADIRTVMEREGTSGKRSYLLPFDIPVTKPVEFAGSVLPIPAYTMGVLLGDGGLTTNTAVVATSDRDRDEMFSFLSDDCKDYVFGPVVSADARKIPIHNKIRYYGLTARNADTLQNKLRSLGLNGLRSHEKFIPDVFKYATVEHRIAILQGLIDTDGTIERRHSLSYTTTSPRLADDVMEIIQSLGGVTTKTSRITHYTYNGVKKTGKRSYTLRIKLPSEVCPVRLSFKKDRWRPLTKYPPVRYITKIEPCGSKPCQCILLDSTDHLYLTDGFIVTHNTLLSLLLPSLMGWERPVLFVPAGLRDKTFMLDIPALSRHWRLLPARTRDDRFVYEGQRVSAGGEGALSEGGPYLEISSYEELSRDYDDYLANRRIPDGIEGDEIHKLAARGSGRTKKLSRFFNAFPYTEFAGFTASLVHRSVLDYGHLTNFALKDTSPLPHSFIELKTWADVIDEGIPDYARPSPGAMWDFCKRGETVRDGYRRRFLETPGIISSVDLSTTIGLQVREVAMPEIPQVIREAFTRLRNHAQTPNGEVAATKLDQLRHARELLLGMYLRWVWPDGKKDKEWIDARRWWKKYVRKMTTRSHGGMWLDTEAQVANAVEGGMIDGIIYDEKTGEPHEAYRDWVRIRDDRKAKWGGKVEPPKKVEWLSDYMLVALEKWASENLGIVWVENIGVLEKLRERNGDRFGCFGAGEDEIEHESGKRSVFATWAHATGKNLQMFNRMCFSNPMQNGKAFEQTLGREHRPNCKFWSPKEKAHITADEVIADVFLGCRETWWSFERSRRDAKYIESTLGQPQRLCKATIISTDEDTVGDRCDAGDPLWAPTGHAKIDAAMTDQEVRESAFPLLTALRAQAKEKGKEESEEIETETEEMQERTEDVGDDAELFLT